MKTALIIAIPAGAALALFAWSLSRMQIETVAMALGMILGIVAGLPAAALVMVAARNRSTPAIDADDDYIDAPVTYADEVTPYYRIARQMIGAPALPERQAQIDELETYLDHLKGRNNSRRALSAAQEVNR